MIPRDQGDDGEIGNLRQHGLGRVVDDGLEGADFTLRQSAIGPGCLGFPSRSLLTLQASSEGAAPHDSARTDPWTS